MWCSLGAAPQVFFPVGQHRIDASRRESDPLAMPATFLGQPRVDGGQMSCAAGRRNCRPRLGQRRPAADGRPVREFHRSGKRRQGQRDRLTFTSISPPTRAACGACRVPRVACPPVLSPLPDEPAVAPCRPPWPPPRRHGGGLQKRAAVEPAHARWIAHTRMPFCCRMGRNRRFKFPARISFLAASGTFAPSTLASCEAKLRPPASLP